MSKRPFLSAYYFRAHMYTLVPQHVRQDMAWDHLTYYYPRSCEDADGAMSIVGRALKRL